MGNKNTRFINTISNDNNLCYTSIPHSRKCPYCNEPITPTQIVYYISKTKINNQGERVAMGKRLPASCGWNCSRKVIDELNSKRSQEEIDKGIEYRRMSSYAKSKR